MVRDGALFIGAKEIPDSADSARRLFQRGVIDFSLAMGTEAAAIGSFIISSPASTPVRTNIQLPAETLQALASGRFPGDKLSVLNSRWAKFSVALVTLPNGVSFYQLIVSAKPTAVVLPINEEGKVLIMRQFKPILNQWFWQLPCGYAELEGEELKDAAARELQEEVGYRAINLVHLMHVFSTYGLSDQRYDVFAAFGLVKVDAAPEEEEQMGESRFVTQEEAFALIRSGEIADAAAVTALLYWMQLGTEEKL